MAGNHHHSNADDGDKEAVRSERAARIRAARAFKNLSQAKVADALGVSVITVKRMERGGREITLDELHAIGDLCGMPRWVMEVGFIRDEDTHSMLEELRALRVELLGAVDSRLAALTEALMTRDEALAASRQALAGFQSRFPSEPPEAEAN